MVGENPDVLRPGVVGRDARVNGHTTTAMHEMSNPPSPRSPTLLDRGGNPFALRSTAVRGRRPRVVPQTPSGRSRPPAGRATRSAMKAKPVALTAALPLRAVPSTPSGRDRPPTGRVMRSAIKAKGGGYEAPTPMIASKVSFASLCVEER